MLKSEALSLDSSNIKVLSNGLTLKVMEIEWFGYTEGYGD